MTVASIVYADTSSATVEGITAEGENKSITWRGKVRDIRDKGTSEIGVLSLNKVKSGKQESKKNG